MDYCSLDLEEIWLFFQGGYLHREVLYTYFLVREGEKLMGSYILELVVNMEMIRKH